ncbi:MAG: hypothetical protein MZV65_49145 [Chromatiales bacterium]|nr:hypothetical protein [Chromatiales bacterium]
MAIARHGFYGRCLSFKCQAVEPGAHAGAPAPLEARRDLRGRAFLAR